MNLQFAAIKRRLLPLRAVSLLVLLVCTGCTGKTPEEWDKEYFDSQVAAIKAGNGDSVDLYDVQGSDALLHSIAGLKGVKRVSIQQMNDITKKGVEDIAALPDLTALALYQIEITDEWLKLFHGSARLEDLDLTPWQPCDFNIATVLALPHLRKLHLDVDVYVDPGNPDADKAERWVDSTLQGLKDAKSLKELRLTGSVFVKRKQDLALLQKELPDCEIKLFEAQGKGDPPQIPLTQNE